MSKALREAAQQALDAFTGLLTFNPTHNEYAKGREAVVALRAALAEDARDWSRAPLGEKYAYERTNSRTC